MDTTIVDSISAVISFFGFFGNLFLIIILASKNLNLDSAIRNLLQLMAGFEASCLIFFVIKHAALHWLNTNEDYYSPLILLIFYPLAQTTLTGSIWTLMALNIERYFAVCLKMESPIVVFYNRRPHLTCTLPLAVASVLFNIPKWFEFRTEIFTTSSYTLDSEETELFSEDDTDILFANHSTSNNSIYVKRIFLTTTNLRNDSDYIMNYLIIVKILAIFIVPIVVVAVSNILIFCRLRKHNNDNNDIFNYDQSSTGIVRLVSLIFLVSHTIFLTLHCYSMALENSSHALYTHYRYLMIFNLFNHTILVTKMSINVVIFFLLHKQFREVALESLRMLKARLMMGRRQMEDPVDGFRLLVEQNPEQDS